MKPANEALEEAVGEGDLDGVKQALTAGAVPDEVDAPLIMVAIEGQNIDVLKALIDAGADVQFQRDADGWTPLHLASINCVDEEAEEDDVFRSDIAEALIQAGADVNARADDGATPVFDVNHYLMVEFLHRHGADINLPTQEGWTPAHLAIDDGAVRRFKLLLELGADLNARTEDGESVEELAMQKPEMAEVLTAFQAVKLRAALPEAKNQVTKQTKTL